MLIWIVLRLSQRIAAQWWLHRRDRELDAEDPYQIRWLIDQGSVLEPFVQLCEIHASILLNGAVV